MKNRIRSIFVKDVSKSNMHDLKSEIEGIRKRTNILCLFGSPTQGNWLGIANATKSLYPDNYISVPQSFSNSLLTEKQTIELCGFISQLNFDKLIISGFATYFFNWIDLLYKDIKIEIIFHGTISEFYEKSRQEFIAKLIQHGNQNKIKRFGFIKKGLDEVFSKLYNFDTYHQPLPTPTIPENIEKIELDKNKIHIGVFGANTFNKNLHNQLIHALMIDNTIIHVLDKSVFSYLQMDSRIIEHGTNLPREKFLSILSSMDLNLYMSFNESWGLVAYESEALGVPCVQSIQVDYLNLINNKLSL